MFYLLSCKGLSKSVQLCAPWRLSHQICALYRRGGATTISDNKNLVIGSWRCMCTLSFKGINDVHVNVTFLDMYWMVWMPPFPPKKNFGSDLVTMYFIRHFSCSFKLIYLCLKFFEKGLLPSLLVLDVFLQSILSVACFKHLIVSRYSPYQLFCLALNIWVQCWLVRENFWENNKPK